MIDLRIVGPDDWQVFRALRLQALEEAPYAFGTKLSDWQGEGDREERWRSRLRDVPFNVVAYLDGRPAGVMSALDPDHNGDVELISTYVAPFGRGRGVGDALVERVSGWAVGRRARRVILGVVEDNANAIALYVRHGFVDDGYVDEASARVAFERRMVKSLDA